MAKFVRLTSTGSLRSYEETAGTPYPIYDQNQVVGSTITAGTAVSLPSSQSYQGDELEVYFRNTRLTRLEDYNFVGSGIKTQISFTFDLVPTDIIRFRIDRQAVV